MTKILWKGFQKGHNDSIYSRLDLTIASIYGIICGSIK